ncbi:MAG: hypothetical protein FWF72_00090 [Paludibacter sp.]|nr:hypothetical protein [Paludibacter sp.]
MTKKIILSGIFAIIMSGAAMNAQVGINTETPAKNSALHIMGSIEKNGIGTHNTIIIPRLTTAQAAAIEPNTATDEGMMYYNTELGCFYFWNKSNGWTSLCGQAPAAAFNTLTISSTGNGSSADDYIYWIDPLRGNTKPVIALSGDILRAGSYIVTSNNEQTTNSNGIMIEGEGNALKSISFPVPLTLTGIPFTAGTYKYTLFYDSDGDGSLDAMVSNKSGDSSKPYTFTITYKTRPLNLLSLGYDAYGTTSTRTDYASAVTRSVTNFGDNGTVKTPFNISHSQTLNGAALATFINNNNIDIILVSYGYNDLNAASVNALVDFVKNKKGVLIFANETAGTATTQTIGMLTKLYGETFTFPGAVGNLQDAILDVHDPILQGPFGNIPAGKFFYNDAGTAYPVSPTPATANVLVYCNNNTARASVFRDTNLGFLFCGDSGWLNGGGNFSISSFNSTTLTGGIPQTSSNNSVNSIIYANALAWAITYCYANENPNYQVSAN